MKEKQYKKKEQKKEKKAQTKQSELKSLKKYHRLDFVLCWPTAAGHEACPEIWLLYPVRLQWESDFSFASGYRLQIAS